MIRDASTVGEMLLTEDPAPAESRCDVVLHIGPTGVWRCHRERGHDGACVARGVVDA